MIEVMMHWEWRIFVSCDSDLDVWRLLPELKPRFDGKRTDVYLSCTECAGLKLRGEMTLEIKLRAERHSTGAEKWSKVLHTSPPKRLDVKDLSQVADVFIQELRRVCGRTDEVIRNAGESGLTALTTTTQKLVSLTKTRYQAMNNGVAVEQTDITVSINSNEHSQWRSISFESSDLKSITKLLKRSIPGETKQLEKHLLQLSDGTLPQGFPQFVMNVL